MSVAEKVDGELGTFRSEAREWLEKNFPPSLKGKSAMMAEEDGPENGGDFAKWKKAMGDKGWGTPTWPKAYGGGGLSAVLANDILIITIAPLLIVGARARGLDPRPFAIALAASTNAGSAATMIGNPQNMLLGSVGRLGFSKFFLICGVPAMLTSHGTPNLSTTMPKLSPHCALASGITARPPAPLRRSAQRSRADQHDIRERAQQPHHELVVLALVGDERIRPVEPGDRHDAVERLDEVRVHAFAPETELTGIERTQLLRQLALRKTVLLPEELEAH